MNLTPYSPSPWSDKGWKESSEIVLVSPCCKAKVWMSRGDGVTMGSCSECNNNVVRLNPRTGKQEIPSNLTPETIQKIANLDFLSTDLNRYLTIEEWLKIILRGVIKDEEGFSGKRPFGSSAWKSNVESALIRAGLVEGSLDADGYIEHVENIDYILYAIIDSW